jgi:alcohol dehydrogenase (NADP+)
MKYLVFSNGDRMDRIGLGTWKATGDQVKQAVIEAVKAGYRYIDTAAIYNNEEAIGEALRSLYEQGVVKREDLFLTSKLWNDAHLPKDVMPALQKSLKKLGTDYLDLYLIHWPVAFKPGVAFPESSEQYLSLEQCPLEATWQMMEKAKADGLVRHVGVSNFSKRKLQGLLKMASVKPEVNQVEMHPLLQQPELTRFCRENDIFLTAYSPLGSGDRDPGMKGKDEPSLFDLEEIKQVSARHKTDAASVLLAWHLQREGCSVIPKSTSPRHITANLKAADLELDKEDMALIAGLDRNYRFITGKFFEAPEKGYTNIYDE